MVYIHTIAPNLPFSRKLITHPIILFSMLVMTALFLWTSMSFLQRSAYNFHFISGSTENEKQPIILTESRELAHRLLEVYEQLEQAFNTMKPPSPKNLQELKLIAAQLYPPVNIDIHVSSSKIPIVCPEEYLGPKSSLGWHTINCTFAQPLKNLITVIINVQEVSATHRGKHTVQLIKDFHDSYPGMLVIIIGSGLSHKEFPKVQGLDISHVVFLEPTKNVRINAPGNWWNNAIKLVKTQFVFIARDITRFSKQSSPLDRVLRVLSEVPGVGAVGGAIRNDNRQWKVGCFQSSIKNYVVKYQKGYHFSKNESMFCDYIDGPFVAYTHLMKQIVLSGSLESDVVFQDFFLTLSRDWLSMICPDVMFYGNGRMTDSDAVLLRGTWLNFARKWELNRIAINLQSVNVLHKYSCGDIGIVCGSKMGHTDYYAIPVCCQEDFAKAMGIFAKFCEGNNMSCQFDSGTCLGAVKMADVIPWDLDGDAGYPELNYSLIKGMAPEFKKHGIQLGRFEDPVCCDNNMPNGLKRSYFQVQVAGMYVELWGDWWIPYDTFLYQNNSVWTDTKIEVHGAWLSGPPNPGYYARKRYGYECLRHAQSWTQTGKKSSWELYNAGHFKKCKDRGHHACLDSLPVDGNIGFMVPE